MQEKRHTTVSIPTELAEKVKKRIEGTGFHSLSSYITYMLRQVISSENEDKEAFTKEDEEKIKRRLKGLGYI